MYKVAQVRRDLRNNPDVFEFDLDQLSSNYPVAFVEAHAFIVSQNSQLFVFDEHCTLATHGTGVKWAKVIDRFACPVCGSMFGLDGSWITGPAPRSLDRFVFYVETADGQIVSSNDGTPIAVDNPKRIWVDPRFIIPGQPRA